MATAYILESDYNNFNAEVRNFTGSPPMLIFQYGGAIFVCLTRFLTSTTQNIAIYRTTNGQDFTSYLGPSGQIDVMFGNDGSKVYAVFLTHGGSGNAVSFTIFDLDTLSYGPIITGGPVANPSSVSLGFQVYAGVIVFFYSRTIAGIPNLFYSTYNSGWGSETFADTMASNGFRGMGTDPATGNMAVVYIPLSPFPTRFRSFSGGVLSAAADNATQLGEIGNCSMLYIPEEDKWASAGIVGTSGLYLFTATPSVNPTTVAAEAVATAPAGHIYRQPAVRREDDNVAVFAEEYLSSGSVPVTSMFSIKRPVGGGAWGSTVAIFDRSTGTFVPPPNDATRDQGRSFLPLSSTIFSFAAAIPGSTLNQYLVSRLVGNVYYANSGGGPYCPVM